MPIVVRLKISRGKTKEGDLLGPIAFHAQQRGSGQLSGEMHLEIPGDQWYRLMKSINSGKAGRLNGSEKHWRQGVGEGRY